MLKIILAVFIVVFIAMSLGVFTLPGAEVAGKTSVCFMGPNKYEPGHGIYYVFYGCTGTFASWNSFGTLGIANTAARFYKNSGITQDVCTAYGGLWEYGNECYLPPNSFERAGQENLKISGLSMAMLTLYTGWEKFYTIETVQMKNNGLWTWFPAWNDIDDNFITMHPHPDKDNNPCQISGGLWVKIKEEAPPECMPSWQCTEWGECQSDSTQTRVCMDTNNCGTLEGKPTETQACVYEGPEIPPEETTPTTIFDMFIGFINGILSGIGAFFSSLLNI